MSYRHGMYETPTYNSWAGMKRRVKRKKSYEGIKVCRRWQKFENFYADMGDRPEGMTLGRKDNDGDYTLSNCRWETSHQQYRNTKQNVWVTIDGETLILYDWCKKLGVKRQTVDSRVRRSGMTHKEALLK